jgi:hypothetical protein
MSNEQRSNTDDTRAQASQHAALPTTEYDLLDLLDRLESLVEDMDDLAIATRDEAEALIATIHQRLDETDE